MARRSRKKTRTARAKSRRLKRTARAKSRRVKRHYRASSSQDKTVTHDDVRVGLEIEYCPGDSYPREVLELVHWRDDPENGLKCPGGGIIVGREISLKNDKTFHHGHIETVLEEWENKVKPHGTACVGNCSMHVHLSTNKRNRQYHDHYLKKMQRIWNNFYKELKSSFQDLELNGVEIEEGDTDQPEENVNKMFTRERSLNLQPMSNKQYKLPTPAKTKLDELYFHIEVRGLPNPYDKETPRLVAYVKKLIAWFVETLNPESPSTLKRPRDD